MIELPIFQNISADNTQTITIEKNRIRIRLVWNVRSNRWIMRLSSGDFVIDGLPLILDYPIIRNHKSFFPILQGDFFCFNKTRIVNDINYNNLGDSIGLYYLNGVELSEWEARNGLG